MKNQVPGRCNAAESILPDLLIARDTAPAAARAHVSSCPDCRQELDQLESAKDLLSTWEAPEPSPFWAARMGARLREEQARPARGWAGFRERMRTRLWLTNRPLRPLAGAAALGLLLAAGGGAWLDFSAPRQVVTPSAQASNTVRDLQSLNENAQVFREISALEGPDTGAPGN